MIRPFRRKRWQLQSYLLPFAGQERYFLLYEPQRKDVSMPLPLILALHGGGGNPRAMARRTQLHEVAGRSGYLVAYPGGSNRRGRRRWLNWNSGGRYGISWAERARIDDVGFIRTVIDAVSREHYVDPSRVYAAGMSKGGMLAYRLACEMADVFAAVAAVAATQTVDGCRPSAPVAILHIHGDRDENVPLAGGKGRWTARFNEWPPVKRGIEFWQRRNDCAPSPRQLADTEACRYWRYDARDGRSDVDFCLFTDCGHTWPRRRRRFWRWLFRKPVPTASASEMIVRFFDEHPKPPRG